MNPAPRARMPLAVLVLAALAATGHPPTPAPAAAVEIVAHRAGDAAGAFTPILDPDDQDDPDNRPEPGDEPDNRAERVGRDDSDGPPRPDRPTGRDQGWGSGAARPPTPTRARPVEVGQSQLARLIEDVTAADGYRYGVRDSVGTAMDAAKVIDKPGGGYLAVYHSGTVTKLATSTDLTSWRFRRDLDPSAVKPTIRATSDGGYLVALEYLTGATSQIKLLHYLDLVALRTGRPHRTFTAPRSLSSCNEGTPSITSARLSPDIDHSVIELGLHYHRGCDTDREATARLTDFRQWKTTAAPGTDTALTRAAAAIGEKISGNIAGRDTLTYGSRRYSLTEVQYVKGEYGTRRAYLYDATTGRARALSIRTHRGSKAFANPTVSRITAPDGRAAIVVGLQLPEQAAAPTEAGQLIYYRALPRSAGEPDSDPGNATRAGSITATRAGGTP